MSEPLSVPQAPATGAFTQWYAQAMGQLVEVVQQLSLAHSLDTIVEIVRHKARQLTGADGATFVLRDGDLCHYYDEDAISPLWKGQRFPMSACISGWAMLNRQSAVIPDIYTDPRIPADAYRPTFVKSLVMVPIRQQAPLGAIGNYWATPRQPTSEEVAILQALADTVSVAFQNAQLYTELNQQVVQLQAQQRRIEEQRDSLAVFTRALAHDLKEPVRKLQAFSSMLLADKVQPEKVPLYLGVIAKASRRMGLLMDAVFHYLQLDEQPALAQETCDLGPVMDSILTELQPLLAAHQVKLTVGALPQVLGRSGLLKSVLLALISNALEHSGKDTGLEITIKATISHQNWLMVVSDNGQGIEEPFQEKIFQPFQRLKAQAQHAGLGLAACRKIVAMHGGQLWCKSTPGQGAHFYFSLPRMMLEPAELAADKTNGTFLKKAFQQELSAQSLANLLLVDDEADLA